MTTGRSAPDGPSPQTAAPANSGCFHPRWPGGSCSLPFPQRQAGVSSEHLATPNGPRRGVVPVGLHAQRPDACGVRGRPSTVDAPNASPQRSPTPKWGFHINRGAELRGRCMQQVGDKQEALKAFGAHGVQPGLELSFSKGAGACKPRSSSQEPARSMLARGIAARSCAELGMDAVDITVLCRKGQGTCSPHNASHARFSASRQRSFERRQEGVRTGCSDIEAVPRSALGMFSPKQVQREVTPATNLMKAETTTRLVSNRSSNPVRRQMTPQPQRPSWPEPQEYLSMIGAEPTRDRSPGLRERSPGIRERSPGVSKLAGNVLAEIRASVPRSPSPSRASSPIPGIDFSRLRRMTSGPLPRGSSSQVSRQSSVQSKTSTTRKRAGVKRVSRQTLSEMSRQTTDESSSSCTSWSSDKSSVAHYPNSARMADTESVEEDEPTPLLDMVQIRVAGTGTVEEEDPVALVDCGGPPMTPTQPAPPVTPTQPAPPMTPPQPALPVTPPPFSDATTASPAFAYGGSIADKLSALCEATMADMRQMETEVLIASSVVSSTRSDRDDFREYDDAYGGPLRASPSQCSTTYSSIAVDPAPISDGPFIGAIPCWHRQFRPVLTKNKDS